MSCACQSCTAIRMRLSPADVRLAERIARERFKEDRAAGCASRFGAPKTEGPDLVGALGEVAFARHVGIEPRKGRVGEHDVGPYEVRSADGAGRSLILHPTDKDADIFTLACRVSANLVLLAGWLTAKEGKHRRYWANPALRHPAFFVPQYELNPMSTLPRLPTSRLS
jgi:hypothetical protein